MQRMIQAKQAGIKLATRSGGRASKTSDSRSSSARSGAGGRSGPAPRPSLHRKAEPAADGRGSRRSSTGTFGAGTGTGRAAPADGSGPVRGTSKMSTGSVAPRTFSSKVPLRRQKKLDFVPQDPKTDPRFPDGRPVFDDDNERADPDNEPMRLSKRMSELGLCSRREADVMIERGWVYVDGERVTELGTKILPHQKIILNQAARNMQQARATILLHKPIGYVSGQPEPGYKPAAMLINPENLMAGQPEFNPNHLRGLAPAGRLDIDSTGLLVMTQDGRIAKQLIGENSEIDKEYLVRVQGRLTVEGMRALNHGLTLDGVELKPAKVSWQNEDQLRFVLWEGRHRQIRRMCELVGLQVVGLKRIRIGRVTLSTLPVGQWRYLAPHEVF
jgi:23S rRNA pseudouridine2604 synthase